MRPLLCTVLLLVSASLAFGEFVPCKPGQASTVGHADGITFQRVSFKEADEVIGATVLIPESKTPVPGILFSHSAIHGPQNSVDLTRFALALARAGAASIILDGTIEWVPPRDNFRPAHLLACAGQWLLMNANLDRTRLAEAGTHGTWGGEGTPLCMSGERPCWDGRAWLNFGQVSNAEWHNTNNMLTPKGRLQTARHAQRWLHLAELKPEWFTSDAPEVSDVVAAH